MSIDARQWKPCPRFSDYEISEFGDIRRRVADWRNHAFGHELKGKITGGYKRFSLRRDGKHFSVLGYQLVALAFIGPKPFEKAEVCHNDGVKLNTHYSNLRWDTHHANHQDRILHGTSNRGAKNSQAKLSPEQVTEIRTRVASGEYQREIAKEFGIMQSAVSRLINGVTWGHLT